MQISFNRFRVIGVTAEEMQRGLFLGIQNSSFEGCILHDYFLLLMAKYQFNGTLQWNTLDENVLSYNYGLALQRFHFATPIFQDAIVQLIEGGFYDRWISHYLKDRFATWKPEDAGPIVLTMNHLSIGFKLWLLMILLSSLAFVGELLYFHVPRYLKAIAVLYSIRAFVRRYH